MPPLKIEVWSGLRLRLFCFVEPFWEKNCPTTCSLGPQGNPLWDGSKYSARGHAGRGPTTTAALRDNSRNPRGLRLNNRWQYQLAELKGLFVNQTDVLTLPLPRPLWWLYPLLRMPLWAWRHFGARQDPRSSASPHL